MTVCFYLVSSYIYSLKVRVMLERARTICIVRVSLSEVNMVSDIIILAVYASSYRNVIFNNNEYSKRILILRWTYLSCEPRHQIIIKDYVTKWHNNGMYRAFAKIDLKKLFGRFNEHSRIKIIRYDRSSHKSRKATSLFDKP
jgi:hypothetical protein